MPPETKPFLHNLMHEEFDLLLMDNLGDVGRKLVHCVNPELGTFKVNSAVGESPRRQAFWPLCRYTPLIETAQSVECWKKIIGYLKKLQPRARIVFFCTHYHNAADDPVRQERARAFYPLFAERMAGSGVAVIPPIELPSLLYKLPDKDHFEGQVYRALAGHLYLTTVAKFDGLPANPIGSVQAPASPAPREADGISVRPEPLPPPPQETVARAAAEPPEANTIPMGIRSYGRGPAAATVRTVAISLSEAVADYLKVAPTVVDEASGTDTVDGWDSLSQLNIMTHLEKVFGIQFAFDDITDAKTVQTIREALRHLGIVASDEPDGASITAAITQDPPSGPDVALESRTKLPPADLFQVRLPDTNLFADFVARALRTPDTRFALFVSRGTERPLDCGGMLRHALGAARRLEHLPRGSIVGIMLPHCEHIYGTFIGCVLAGLIPTILPPLTSKQDPEVFRRSMDVLLQRVRPGALFTTRALEATLPSWVPVQRIEDIEPVSAETLVADVNALPATDPAATAFLQHSSGTTGHKKGVMLSHATVRRHVTAYAASIGLRPRDGIASWLPLSHDMGLITSFLMPTIMGNPIVSLDAMEWVANPTLLLHHIERQRTAFVWLPNFAFHHIVRADDGARTFDLTSLRGVISCSEPARSASFDAFAGRYAAMGCGPDKLGVSYAMAENVFAVTQTGLGVPTARDPASPYLSSGTPLPGVEIEIRGEDGKPAAEGEVGAIHLRGPFLFEGYHAQPELTAERLHDGWYDTRDIGRVKDGQLTVYGRNDDMLIVNGRNIIAHEVEDEVSRLPGVAPGRVLLCAPHDQAVGSDRLSLLAEPSDNADEAALKASLRDAVLAICGIAPTYIAVLPRGFLIKSTSGKIAREESKRKWLDSSWKPDMAA
ncbi:AMP-binding protein [Methylorubrum salsuginis]|uniref:Acyl-CoA synthetase (AMP-forming)/AMP-acid ligase II n=1 Tax=Methylorubrum salsuginis TaxID=414703 RepID=A0A1I3YEV5_9HYPH|nr:AMP-binding protein [Methylorubrum salsuginis]SFK30300.1 Acyl-CoA synthetase (AMP-forming)/AMP-acid ligase II [Methylorubrum salsuginis]